MRFGAWRREKSVRLRSDARRNEVLHWIDQIRDPKLASDDSLEKAIQAMCELDLYIEENRDGYRPSVEQAVRIWKIVELSRDKKDIVPGRPGGLSKAMIKNYIGFSLDMSYSMTSGGLTRAAMNDYNRQIEGIRALAVDIDTIVSVVFNGVGDEGRVQRHVINSSMSALRLMTSYVAKGASTPLLDSVGELIDIFEAVPDAKDPGVSFLVETITDGQENSSKRYRQWSDLVRKMRELQATDRWTFIFRVPFGGLQATVGKPWYTGRGMYKNGRRHLADLTTHRCKPPQDLMLTTITCERAFVPRQGSTRICGT
jgi:hypothetical protein